MIEADGQPAGRLRVARTTEFIELCGIQLRPDVQGRGIGTAVIASLQAEAATLHRPLDLAVEKDNPRARRLYERLGFEPAGETDDEYQLRWTAGADRTGQVAGG